MYRHTRAKCTLRSSFEAPFYIFFLLLAVLHPLIIYLFYFIFFCYPAARTCSSSSTCRRSEETYRWCSDYGFGSWRSTTAMVWWWIPAGCFEIRSPFRCSQTAETVRPAAAKEKESTSSRRMESYQHFDWFIIWFHPPLPASLYDFFCWLCSPSSTDDVNDVSICSRCDGCFCFRCGNDVDSSSIADFQEGEQQQEKEEEEKQT